MWSFIKFDPTIPITISGIAAILYCIGNFLWKKNTSYYILIKEFRNKLPRPQNSAKPYKSKIVPHFNTLNISTHKASLTEADLDVFFNSLQHFDYSWMLYKSHYCMHAKNLFRFDPKAENKNFDLVMLQYILNGDALHPIKPFDVFIYHLKYKHKVTSKPYLYFFSKRKKVKL